MDFQKTKYENSWIFDFVHDFLDFPASAWISGLHPPKLFTSILVLTEEFTPKAFWLFDVESPALGRLNCSAPCEFVGFWREELSLERTTPVHLVVRIFARIFTGKYHSS